MKTYVNLFKKITAFALVTAFLLLIPLVAMQFAGEVNWDLSDFVIMGILIFGSGLTYILVAKGADNFVYRVDIGVALVAVFLLVWVNLAVGLIGAGPNPGNLMYIGVLAVGVIGITIANFNLRGMQRVIFAMVLSLVLVIVLSMGMQHYSESSVIEILDVNGFFIVLFTFAALLFRYAERGSKRSGAEPTT